MSITNEQVEMRGALAMQERIKELEAENARLRNVCDKLSGAALKKHP